MVPRLLALYRSTEHAFSLEGVSKSDKRKGACIAVLKHHYKMSAEDLKGKLLADVQELLEAKLQGEKAALP